jgi:ABC-type Fe3+-hydroxamate transport system substrate-binding protein
MPEYNDQLNNRIVLPGSAPKRIVSLVPSQTELLYYLGLEEEVVGITKFCVHPQSWFGTKTRVGGTKAIHIDAVRHLNPDLIIANKEENVKEQVEALKAIAPVWVSDIENLDAALDMIEKVGEMVDKKQRADELVALIKTNFSKLVVSFSVVTNQLLNQSAVQPRIVYFIWRDPYMTVGGDTFIGDMIRCCGFTNIFEDELRYPQVTLEQLAALNCQYIFLSSEPFPFKEKHAAEIKKVLPNAKIIFVDGEMFSWYGSRLLQATQYFKELKERLNVGDKYWV